MVSIENLENLKYHTFSKKHYFFLTFAVSAEMNVENFFVFKKKNELRY